ncbi:MAG: DUF2851 family protein [Saprospiraceae bacterium]|nr:DUF2851 family protein [Saprospiraceae bacterium]
MKEDLLQFIWRYQLYNRNALATASGEELQIIHPGNWNKTDAGPDFENARIKIGRTEWAGHIELHVNSSDWQRHGHQGDRAYRNVILHVVFNDDGNGPPIPTLELQPRIKHLLIQNYEDLRQSLRDIPCAAQIDQINALTWVNWKSRLLAERLEVKTERIRARLIDTNYNWNQVFYEFLGYNFGLSKNGEAFLEITRRLPLNTLLKHKNNILQMEALLFGTAGFLEKKHSDTYPKLLRKEFLFLRKKYKLAPISPVLWRFATMRPAAFPTIRLAQFVQVLFQSESLFGDLLYIHDVTAIKERFAYPASEYWDTHYTFDNEKSNRPKRIGATTVENILINTIIPFKFLYGQRKQDQNLIQKSLQLLETIRPEKKSITKRWQALGISIEHAFDSQALIYLRKQYCAQFRCLHCQVGVQLLKQTT